MYNFYIFVFSKLASSNYTVYWILLFMMQNIAFRLFLSREEIVNTSLETLSAAVLNQTFPSSRSASLLYIVSFLFLNCLKIKTYAD